MTGPKPPSKKRKLTEEEELEVEAYGAKGAALRRTAAGVGKSAMKSDSTATQKLSARVKSFLKRSQGG